MDSWLRMYSFWIRLIAALDLGSFAIFASLYWSFSWYVEAELARSFGEALIIAAFIASIVDRYMKWRLLHEVSEDVSRFLIGWRLPRGNAGDD